MVFTTRGLEAHYVDDSGELILHDPATGEMAVLNPVGSAAYDLLDGQRTVSAIATLLAEHFSSVAPEQIMRDVEAFLLDLSNRKLITTATA